MKNQGLKTSDDKLKSISSLEELEEPTILTSIQDVKLQYCGDILVRDIRQLEDAYTDKQSMRC